MSPIEAQKPQYNIFAAMAGEAQNLPPVDLIKEGIHVPRRVTAGIVAGSVLFGVGAATAVGASAGAVTVENKALDLDNDGRVDVVDQVITFKDGDFKTNNQPVKLDGATFSVSSDIPFALENHGMVADFLNPDEINARPLNWGQEPSISVLKPNGLYDGFVTHREVIETDLQSANFVIKIDGTNASGPYTISDVDHFDFVSLPIPPGQEPTPPVEQPKPPAQRICLVPELSATLKHLGGKNSNKWVAQLALSGKGTGRLLSAGNFADKNAKKAKSAAGFTMLSSTPYKVVKNNHMIQTGKVTRIDQTKDVTEGVKNSSKITFTTLSKRALPKLSFKYNAPAGTVVDCDTATATSKTVKVLFKR